MSKLILKSCTCGKLVNYEDWNTDKEICNSCVLKITKEETRKRRLSGYPKSKARNDNDLEKLADRYE